MKPIASLSLDLDNKWSYMKTHGDAGWESLPSYLDACVPRVLEFLRERDLKITFFVVGQDAALDKNREAIGQISAAGHEIGVDVGFCDMSDSDPFRGGHPGVLLGVPVGIKDDRLAGLTASDEVAGLGQLRVVESFEDHSWKLIAPPASPPGRSAGSPKRASSGG